MDFDLIRFSWGTGISLFSRKFCYLKHKLLLVFSKSIHSVVQCFCTLIFYPYACVLDLKFSYVFELLVFYACWLYKQLTAPIYHSWISCNFNFNFLIVGGRYSICRYVYVCGQLQLSPVVWMRSFTPFNISIFRFGLHKFNNRIKSFYCACHSCKLSKQSDFSNVIGVLKSQNWFPLKFQSACFCFLDHD